MRSTRACAARWWWRTGSAAWSSTPDIPLYEVRKGDIWYQLETALREVCVAIPEATVPEFERRVNELMLVSLSLTERRRRARRPARPRTPPLLPP